MSRIGIPWSYAVRIALSRSVRSFSALRWISCSRRSYLIANALSAARASGDLRLGREMPGSLNVFWQMG